MSEKSHRIRDFSKYNADPELRQQRAAAREAIRYQQRHEKQVSGVSTQLRPVVTSLVRSGNAVIISDDKVSRELLDKALMDRTKKRILWLPSEGNIQGEALDDADAEATLGAVSQYRRETKGFGIVAFYDGKFGPASKGGNKLVVTRVQNSIKQQKDDYRRHLFTPHNGLGFLVVGRGGQTARVQTSADQESGTHLLSDFDGIWFNMSTEGEIMPTVLTKHLPFRPLSESSVDTTDSSPAIIKPYPIGGARLGELGAQDSTVINRSNPPLS